VTAAGRPASAAVAAAAEGEAPLLSVRRLGKSFRLDRGRELAVLRDVSFDVGAGEVVALVGESGSGKSTTALLIARLLVPTTGEIRLRGVDVLASEPRHASLAYRRQVQMIFQDPFASLNPIHTIRYHLERPLLRHGEARAEADLAEKVNRLLETVGLTPAADFARRHPHQLSGGQRQRVAIARALSVNPALIVADEPTSMLDVSLRIDLLNLMRDIKSDRRIGYLFITHDLGSARYFADRLLVMYAGEIVEAGRCDDVLDAPAHPYTRLLISSVPSATAALGAPEEPGGGVVARTAPVIGRGCPFADRCPSVMDRCHEQAPALRPLSPGRTVRCHLYP
jgi:peptide/nickel transport system ATP-binding protein